VAKLNVVLVEKYTNVIIEIKNNLRKSSIPFWDIFFVVIIILLFITMNIIFFLIVEKSYEYSISLIVNISMLLLFFRSLQGWIRSIILVGGIISFIFILYLNFFINIDSNYLYDIRYNIFVKV
jgi:hypothetical protein